MKKKLLTLFTLLLCAVGGANAEEITVFQYRFTGSEVPTLDEAQSATGGTITLKTSDAEKAWATEGATYNAAVASDMKGGSKGLKAGANALYIAITLTSGTFEEGDVISVCGYNPWLVSTSTSHNGDISGADGITTGDGKTNYNVGSVTIPEGISTNTIYLRRQKSSGTGFAAIKITRTVSDRTAVSLSFASATANVNLGESFTAPVLTVDPVAATSEVVYRSSNTAVATVAADGTVTIKAGGTTTITASISGSENYKDASASYVLTVVDPDMVVFGLTQDDLTTSTGIATTTTYAGSYATLTATSAAMTGSSSTRSLTNGTTSLTAAAKACQRNNLCSSASNFVEDSYYAFTVDVESGYVLNITKFFGDLYYETSRSGKYKFAVYVGLSKVWEASSSDYVTTGGSNKSQKALDVTSVDALKNLTGSVQVRMVWYQNGGSSYVALKDFNIEATIKEDTRTTYDLTTTASPAEGGTILRSPAAGSYVEGMEVTLTANANSGYYFVNWTDAEDNVVGSSTNYVHTMGAAAATFTANFAKYPVISFALGESGATGTIPAATFTSTGSFVIPANNSLYIAGKTLTAWNDGETDYPIGSTINGITSDITLTPVFTTNTVSLNRTISNVIVNFPFTQDGGAPIMAAEGNSTMRVAQATIGEGFMDVLMDVDATAGKFNNNQGSTDACQVNATVVIEIPAISGMTVAINKEFTTSYLGEESNIGVKEGGSTTWTYNGSGETVKLTLNESNKYPTQMTVTYPKTMTFIDVTSAGYRTFASSSALDFTGTIDGLTAYRAEVSGEDVTFEVINTEVPAGEGMLIKAAVGRYYVPLAAGSPAAIDNAFVGVTASTEVTEPAFILFKDETHPIGFYKTTAASFTMGANTAYLPASVSARSFIGFEEGETTGISATLMNSEESIVNNVFDLQGRRVAQPTKGLYIVNGKKVIVK